MPRASILVCAIPPCDPLFGGLFCCAEVLTLSACTCCNFTPFPFTFSLSKKAP